MVTIFFRWSDRNFSSLGIFGWWFDLSGVLKAAVILGPIIFLAIIITFCCCCKSRPSNRGVVIATRVAPAVMATNVNRTVQMRPPVEQAWIRRWPCIFDAIYCLLFLQDFVGNRVVVAFESVKHYNSFSRWRPNISRRFPPFKIAEFKRTIRILHRVSNRIHFLWVVVFRPGVSNFLSFFIIGVFWWFPTWS